MSEIKTWQDRCEEHPDHQDGMVTNWMTQQRMQEEIDELRTELSRYKQGVEGASHVTLRSSVKAGCRGYVITCVNVPKEWVGQRVRVLVMKEEA